MDRGPRGPKDDFFCWKFRVWYNLSDCVFRHAWETHPDCADCEQGAGNLKLLGHVPPPPRWAELLTVELVAEHEDEGTTGPSRARRRFRLPAAKVRRT